MTKEEMKNKYSAFITEISEILGLGKPVDILKLCATTDLFFQSLENRITELEKACEETQELLDKQIEATYMLDKENAELKNKLEHRNCVDCSNHSSKLRMRTLELEKECTKAKQLLAKWVELFKPKLEGYPITPIQEQTEQFLSEVAK